VIPIIPTPKKLIPTIIEDILNEHLTSEKNFEWGGSINTFKQCIKRNNGIGKKVELMLFNAINKKPEKHIELKKYLERFLEEKEQHKLKNQDINDVLKYIINKINNRDKKRDFIRPTEDENFKIINLNQLLKMGFSLENIVKISISLDYDTIENLTEEHNGSLEQWINVSRFNADTIRWLLNSKNNIIGYWHFTTLFDEPFKKAKKGVLLDSEITVDKIPVLLPGTYNIYFVGICLLEEHRRKTTTFGKLLFSILEVIENLAKRNVFIDEICALAYTKNGIQLSKSIGLKYLRDHEEHGEIYWGKIKNLLDKKFCENFIDLKNLYGNRI
jgi:hypothetical protein